jgi:threonine dehydratase
VAAWIKRANPRCRVIGVEPAGSDVVRRSRAAGRPVELPDPSTIADGLRSDRTGELVLAHVTELVDDVIVVDDASILRATRLLFLEAKLVVEHSGAAALAALLADPRSFAERRIAVVVSGGNIDPAAAAEVLRGEDPDPLDSARSP